LPSSLFSLLPRFIQALLREGSDAPRLLEQGGEAVRRTKKGTRRLRYRPRPYMGPAFEQEKQQLPSLWRNSVR
jgi:hypothetical protein